MKSSYKKQIGQLGEDIAATEASQRGYTILERNVRSPFGEIDLVLEKDGWFVFAEVKTRSTDRYGYPEEGITEIKLQHMVDCAMFYLNQLNPDDRRPFRLDAISIRLDESKRQADDLIWLENITSEL